MFIVYFHTLMCICWFQRPYLKQRHFSNFRLLEDKFVSSCKKCDTFGLSIIIIIQYISFLFFIQKIHIVQQLTITAKLDPRHHMRDLYDQLQLYPNMKPNVISLQIGMAWASSPYGNSTYSPSSTVQQFTLHRHRLWKANGKGLVVGVLVLCHSYEAQLAGFHYRM